MIYLFYKRTISKIQLYNIMKVLFWIISGLMAAVILLMGLIYALPGYGLYIVRSDSMKPVFASGDLIITVPAPTALNVGAIVTYKNGVETISHRVVALTTEGVITKGDANEGNDALTVTMAQVQGVYLMKVPYAGYAGAFVQTRTGWLVCVILPSVLLLAWIVKDILREALNPEGALTAKTSRSEQREKTSHAVRTSCPDKLEHFEKPVSQEKIARPMKMTRSEKAVCNEKSIPEDNPARTFKIISATDADRRYYAAFKPQKTKNTPIFDKKLRPF